MGGWVGGDGRGSGRWVAGSRVRLICDVAERRNVTLCGGSRDHLSTYFPSDSYVQSSES